MMPASCKAGGSCFGFPDVCKVPAPPAPPIPTPFPNTCQVMQASKTSKKVKITNKETVTLKSEVPKSMGDEAGTLKGVVSSTNMDKVIYKKGSSKVKVEGQPVIHLTAMSAHNGANANLPPGQQIAPSQAKVKVMP